MLTSLPQDPTEEELTRDWSLFPEDRALIGRCREEDHKRRLALQVGALRALGRFLDNYTGIPPALLGHISRQLGLGGVLFVGSSGRASDATESDLRRRAREHLGYRPFDEEVRTRLEAVLATGTYEELVVGDLPTIATRLLREWKVVLPGSTTLSRICGRVGAQGRHRVYEAVAGDLEPAVRTMLDTLLIVDDERRISAFAVLKEDPAAATPQRILRLIRQYHALEALRLGFDVTGVTPTVLRCLAGLARCHDASDLREIPEPKRHALLACFAVEGTRTALDRVVDLHDQYLLGVERKARRSYERTYRHSRRQAREGMDTMVEALEFVLDDGRSEEALRECLFRRFGEEGLREALQTCRHFRDVERAGRMAKVRNFYPSLRQYLPELFELPFEAESGSEPLLEAIALVRQLDAAGRRDLPVDTPLQFLSKKYRRAVTKENGTLDRALWEIGLAKAVKDALRSGDLFLPRSRHHVSFWNLVHGDEEWESRREQGYQSLALSGPDHAIDRLRQEFEEVASATAEGLATNSFASVENGKLRLGRDPAKRNPRGVAPLRRELTAALPRTRLEQVLLDVDGWCDFTQAFHPIDGSPPRSDVLDGAILATLVAHGTNLGIAAMGRSAEGITADQLRHVSRWNLREDTLKAANAIIIAHLDGLELTSVWGDGTLTSSDGQRFAIRPSSYLGAFYPRYLG